MSSNWFLPVTKTKKKTTFNHVIRVKTVWPCMSFAANSHADYFDGRKTMCTATSQNQIRGALT